MLKITKDGLFKETKKAGLPGAIATHPDCFADPILWLELWVPGQCCHRDNDVPLRNVLPLWAELKAEVDHLLMQAHPGYGHEHYIVDLMDATVGMDRYGKLYDLRLGTKPMSFKQVVYVLKHKNGGRALVRKQYNPPPKVYAYEENRQ